jgi:hypothetical protein
MPMLENLGKLTFRCLSHKASAFRMTNAEEIDIAALNLGIHKDTVRSGDCTGEFRRIGLVTSFSKIGMRNFLQEVV